MHPAPAATPFTAAIVGMRELVQPQCAPADDPHRAERATDAPASRSPALSVSVRSAPEQKPSPAPVITSTRTSRRVRDLVEQLDQLAPHLPVHRVLLLGPVERDGHDAVGAVDEQGLHGGSRCASIGRRYRSCVGFNPFREQVKRRSDIVIVVGRVRRRDRALVLWAVFG